MRNGLVEFQWKEIDKYTSEEISYFLYLEGKSIKAISKIRNIPEEIIQNHVINGKIKYKFLVDSENPRELLANLSKAVKQDKLMLLTTIDNNSKLCLLKYINDNYTEMVSKHKETAIWIIGELKDNSCNKILIKATVHKSVNVRRMAISAIGKIGDESFESTLIRALDDENPQVICYAISALIKIKIKSAEEKINKIKIKTDKDYVKQSCDEYLNMILSIK